jgi:SRSO17 transposase
MSPEQIQALGPALADFLQPFFGCCQYAQTFDLLQLYCRGLLSDLARKTCEPVALYAGVAVRTLQEFLRDHVWSFPHVRDRLQQHVATVLPTLPADDLGTLGIIDETATVKKGRQTPGVQRQWCGEKGKQENCIVTVHLGVARGRYKTLVDAELFLPESWDRDRDRCRQACIPDDIHYRPKWQIALEEIDRARTQGITLDWLTFDEGYGDKPGFLKGLDDRQLHYVGEVPKSLRCFTRRPRSGQAGHRADDLVRHSPVFARQLWRTFRLQRQTVGAQEWQVKAAQVWLSWDGRPTARTYWLIWARNRRTGEEKYFVSNAPARTALRRLLRVAFGRWNVEHCFRVSKSEIGFRHYEGRSYGGLLRHLTLCLVTLTFAAGQAERLRGEKPGGHAGTGLRRVEPRVPGVAGRVAGDEPIAGQVRDHRLSPRAQPVGAGIAAAAAARRAGRISTSGGPEDTQTALPQTAAAAS